MRTEEFNYQLPQDLIAQTPVEPRDSARLLVVRRSDGELEHRHFYDLPRYLRAGDLLVANESRVMPAHLVGHKVPSGGRVEVLLLRPDGGQGSGVRDQANRQTLTPDPWPLTPAHYWEALVSPGRPVPA